MLPPLPGKWVLLGRTVEGRKPKKLDFFTCVQWPLIRVLLIKAAILDDTALSKDVVIFRKGWDKFTSSHPSLQVFRPKFETHAKTLCS